MTTKAFKSMVAVSLALAGMPVFAGEAKPLSAASLYVAARQFSNLTGDLEGVWRHAPASLEYDTEALGEFVTGASDGIRLMEIGTLDLQGRTRIVAVFEQGGAKYFAVFNDGKRVSYRTVRYNAYGIEVPETPERGPSLEAACRTLKATAERMGTKVVYRMQGVSFQGNRYEGCFISSQGAGNGEPFAVSRGSTLFRKGWLPSSERAADGGGVALSAMENGRIFCRVETDYNDPQGTVSVVECFRRQ